VSHVPVEDALNITQLPVKTPGTIVKPKGSVHRYPHVSHLELISVRRAWSLTGLPALAGVEGLLFVAMNVRTWMLDLARPDNLDATETLRS
jgi:hypothetical protein